MRPCIFADMRGRSYAKIQKDGVCFVSLILLIVIYIAFIGLGIPDSLFGSAWPAIYAELELPVSYVSIVTMMVSGCTVVSSILSDRIIHRFGTGKVAAVSTLMTACALLGFSFSNHFLFMCLLAVPLGLGAGAIDSGLNNYLALHYDAKHINFLHCFYGIGVTVSPLLMSFAIGNGDWRGGYQYAFLIQLLIALVLIASLGLWRRNTKKETGSVSDEDTQTVLSLGQMCKMPAVRTAWAIMFTTNAIECVCSAWGATYLSEARQFAAQDSAWAMALYYVGLALGRFLSGVFSKKIHTWQRVHQGIVGVVIAVGLLFFPGSWTAMAGLFMVGFGNGAIYPNLVYLTPYNFGKDVSQSVMGTLVAVAYIGFMFTPALFGLVSGAFEIGVFPVFLLVLLTVMAVCVFIFEKQLKAAGRYNREIPI